MAYARLEPFGPEADDWRLAQLLALTAEINRDRKKRQRPYTPEDFMPRRGPAKEPDPLELKGRIDSAMAAWGGKKA